jgi:hypothetical protein
VVSRKEKNEIKLPATQLGITPKLYMPSTYYKHSNRSDTACSREVVARGRHRSWLIG